MARPHRSATPEFALEMLQPRPQRCQTNRTASAPSSCGPPELFARSYTLTPRWPLDPFHLIMELTAPGTCDLYKARSTCCLFTLDNFPEPERHVADAIASFLAQCGRRPSNRRCASVDLGANNGWFTAMMLQSGSRVTAVEPSPNLARAVRQTGEVNCWADRLTVVNARACHPEAGASCFMPHPASCDGSGWRYGNGPSIMVQAASKGWNCSEKLDLPVAVGGVELFEVLKGAARPPAHGGSTSGPYEIDLIKMDVDGMEGAWMDQLLKWIRDGKIRVDHIIVEGSRLKVSTMHQFDVELGYTFYRLDEHDGRRYMTRDGWDAFSPAGTISRLDRYREQHRRYDAQRVKYSPKDPLYQPAADNVSRLELEDEVFSV